VGLRGPLAPGPAVAERRASDVLPAAVHARSAGEWTAALVATVARTAWLAAVLTAAFLAGVFGATLVQGGSVSDALPWALIGGGVWLAVALIWTLLRQRRDH
jgi:hypothetical protein